MRDRGLLHLRDVEIMTGCVADAVEPRGTDTTCLGKTHWCGAAYKESAC